jgi:hypothetical protein
MASATANDNNSSIAVINRIIAGEESPAALAKLKQACIEVKSASKYQVDDHVSRLIGCKPCRVSLLSQDGRSRAQKAVQIPLKGNPKTTRVNFRPWHLAYAYAGNEGGTDVWRSIPLEREWSHRCTAENCIEVSHGVWETSAENKSRWSCRNCAQVIINGAVHMLCTHQPPCLNPKVVANESLAVLPIL